MYVFKESLKHAMIQHKKSMSGQIRLLIVEFIASYSSETRTILIIIPNSRKIGK